MRVITGKARGSSLKLPLAADIRPTTDKVKEAVFSTIQFLLEGRSFLDLFSGSGQMGIEALSRGAKSAVFVEKNIKSVNVIRENLKHTKLEMYSTVENLDVQTFLLRNTHKFDIIYMDPPYYSGKLIFDTLAKSIQTAIKNNLISEKEYEDYSRYITRFEAAKIISQYIKLDDVSKNRNIFKDLSNDEKDIILKLVKLKVISGYSDNTFRSDNLLTRAEACKIIINAYNEKQELMKTRKGELVSSHTNIKDADNANIDNTYQIKNNRIYIYDLGRYAKLNGQTLNQEYIKDRIVINLLKNLVSEESYVELKFVPDKYIINNLNICYGNTKNEVQNGNYIFEIRFYENSYYNVAVSKDNEEFMSDACIKIKTGKMWNKKFECETDISCSEKNLFKLKQAVGIIIDKEIEDEFIKYFIEKRIEASKIPNSDEPKISEVKKIGEYTINTFCINNNDLEFYIKKF